MKALLIELRTALSEWLLELAFDVAPKEDGYKKCFAESLYLYVGRIRIAEFSTKAQRAATPGPRETNER